MKRRLRLGMVGGGEGAFIGAVHRIAARIDDRFELVAGALSSEPERATASAASIGLARSYADFREMASIEAAREDGIDAVAIVTPNHLHARVATAFLEAGIHVICDKPLAVSLDEGEALARLAREKGLVFAVTYTYTGYPLVRHARSMVQQGALGEVRLVNVEYAQDWLSLPRRARVEPAGRVAHRSGAGRACRLPRRYRHARVSARGVRDGERPSEVSAEVSTFVREPADRRPRPGDAALCERRARLAVGEPGRGGRGERAAPARVRHEGGR